MITIFLGSFEEYNRHRLEEIEKCYYPALIIKRSNIKGFFNWIKNIKRPVIGDRILVEITEVSYEKDKNGNDKKKDYNRRDFDRVLPLLEEIKEHDFLDVVWIIDNKSLGRFNDILTDLPVVNLRRTYREDVLSYVRDKLHSEVNAKLVLSRIKYSWKLYKMYESALVERKIQLSPTVINEIILTKSLPSPIKILEDILMRQKSGIRDYYKMCNRYSKSWMDETLLKYCQKILDLKTRVYINRETSVFNNDDNKKFRMIVNNIKRTDVFVFYLLLKSSNYAVEYFIADSSIDTLKF